MKFPITVIHDLAKHLRGTQFSKYRGAIGGYSEALHAAHIGGTVSRAGFEALVNVRIENVLPLPYHFQDICTSSMAIKLGDMNPVKVDTDLMSIAMRSVMGDFSPVMWNIVIEGDDDKLYLVASSDDRDFEPGELVKELWGALDGVAFGNVTVDQQRVEYFLRDWSEVGGLFSTIMKPTFNRCIGCEAEEATPDSGSMPLVLEEVAELGSTFIHGDVCRELNIPVSEGDMLSVKELAEIFVQHDKETIDVTVSEEDMQLIARIQKAVDFDAVLEEVKALPVKKRTVKAIGDIIYARLGKKK